MDVVKNSVWNFNDVDGFPDGLYRIVEMFVAIDSVILFYLNDTSPTSRLKIISLSVFFLDINSKHIFADTYPLPTFLLLDEDSISGAQRVRRDKNYQLIEGLVSDKEFLFDYATKERVAYLTIHADKMGSNSKKIARLLTQYWRNGQDKMALLSAFSNSGAPGKERKAEMVPLGAPKIPRTLSIEKAKKYILTGRDKSIFGKALKKYHLKPDGKTLSETYANMLRDSYADEIRVADILDRPPCVPTQKQFGYWASKMFSKDQIIRARTTERDYLLNKRAVLGCVAQSSILPGSVFEIDATVADVHIVSEFGSRYVLGRPTIYIVVDRASRMIAGLHVSLFHASWRAARQALVNCFMPKVAYCTQFGIDIDETEWPCSHIPQCIVCDNGEMIGLKPEQLVTPMTELKFAPPYRADCKSVVEKRFDILNKEVIHDLLGTTRGGKVVRGSRNPKKDAVHTIHDVTSQLIQAVLEHNRSIFDELALTSALLIENDLSPTPVNYWKIHMSKHMHALKQSYPDEVISRLLPPAEVSMTRSGIHYNGLYYSCAQVEQLNLASVARVSGRWKLDARIDENTTNYIYVRLDKNQCFTRCALLPRSRMLEGKSMVEAELIQEWLEAKKTLKPVSVESIDEHKRRQVMKTQAVQRNQSASTSSSEKMMNTRQHREDEIKATTNAVTERNEGPGKAEQKQVPSKHAINGLPRRNK